MPLFVLFLLASPAYGEPCIVISEIMYHSAEDGEVLEFIELYNPEPPRVDLSQWRITGEIDCEFPPGTVLLPGKRLVIARAPALLKKVYSIKETVLPFAGRLGNGGGRISLVNPAGIRAFTVRYDDNAPWPVTPDGTGHSLCLIDPLFGPSDPESWAPSLKTGGTPGAPNGLTKGYGQLADDFPRTTIRINEVKAGPDAFVELFNTSPEPISLENHFFTDTFKQLKKYTFPASVAIKPFDHLVLSRDVFDDRFSLPKETIEFAITAPDGGRVIDCMKLDKLEENTAHGCFPDGSGRVFPLSKPTPGAANTVAETPDLVISEIMYHSITEQDEAEYIELYNRSTKPVALSEYRITGAISFTFPEKAQIAAHRFIVVAKDPDLIAGVYRIPKTTVFGPFKRSLSNSGETITLKTPEGLIVDSVTYSDRAPWPEGADGLGSSLELVNLEMNNDFPAAWKASDEKRKARWVQSTYKGVHHKFQGRSVSEFQFLLLDAGECLIDSVQLVAPGERLIVEGFERGAFNWQGYGTHQQSGPTVDPASSSRRCFLIKATDNGDPRNNYVAVNFNKKLEDDKVYYLRFRAKWQHGSPQLLTRSVGQGIAKTHTIPVPRQLGTPGAKNSINDPKRIPLIGAPRQDPVSPGARQKVTVSVPIDLTAASADILYRRNGASTWHTAALSKSQAPAPPGQTIWTGTIPPQVEGTIQYYIEAKNGEGQSGIYPPDAPGNVLLYQSGLTCHDTLPTYHLLVSHTNWQKLTSSPRLSNNRTGASLVYGTDFLYHHASFRPRGSPFTRAQSKERNANWRIYFGEKTLGDRDCITLDRQSQDGSKTKERVVHWLLSQMKVPSSRQRYAYFHLSGFQRGIYEDVERIDGDFIERWFPGQGDGNLHKIDDYWEISSGQKAYVEARFIYKGPSPEPYRWNFPARASGTIEDFMPFIKLTSLLDPAATKTPVFLKEVENTINVSQWLRAFAVRTIVDDRDTMGRGRGKNAYVYRTPGDVGLWHLLVWDSDLTFRNPNTPIIEEKFTSFKRFLSQEKYRTLFLGYLGSLALGPLSEKELLPVVKETAERCGGNPDSIVSFSKKRCAFIREKIPAGGTFTIQRARRIHSEDAPDVLRCLIQAPCLATRFSLDSRPGTTQLVKENTFLVDFPVGPEGGKAVLAAELYSGRKLAAKDITFSPRDGAKPLERFTPEPPQQLPAPTPPYVSFALNMGEKLTDPSKYAGSQTKEVVQAPVSGGDTGTDPASTAQAEPKPEPQAPDPFAQLEKRSATDPFTLPETKKGGERDASSPREVASRSASQTYNVKPREIDQELSSIGQDTSIFADPNAAPSEAGASGTGSRGQNKATSSGSSFLPVLAIIIVVLVLAALLGASFYFKLYHRFSKKGASPSQTADTKQQSAGSISRSKLQAAEAELRRRSHPKRSASSPAAAPSVRPPAATPAPSQNPADKQIAELAGGDFERASLAFQKLLAMGGKSIPFLLKAQYRSDATPFGKIRKSGTTYKPYPASESAAKPLSLHIIAQFLIKVIKQSS